MPAVSGHDQGTPADQARAEQRRDRGGVARFAERKAVTGIGDKVRGKATVARVAREQRTIAKIFLTTPAIGAFAAGVTEPGNPDAVADLDGGYTGAKRLCPADDLMTGNDGIADAGQLAIHDMQISPAHPAGADRDAHGAGPGRRIVPLLKLERRAGRRQNHGVHRVCRPHNNRTHPIHGVAAKV
jgi:hypothetical protein